MTDLLLRDVRVVLLDESAPGARDEEPGRRGHEPVDVLVRDGVVAEVGPGLAGTEQARGVPELDGQGRHAIPGLWDQHVHMVQWGLRQVRLDTSGTGSPQEVLERVAARILAGGRGPSGVLVGFGHRAGTWSERMTVQALDDVSGEVPVVLIAADAHHGWLNSAALRMLGGPGTTGVVAEEAWFQLYDRLQRLPGATEASEEGVARGLARAQTEGVVGLVDLEFGQPWQQWKERTAEGLPQMRARTAVYPLGLDQVIESRTRTGDPIRATDGLVTMGPLKIITDGSLNTRTAWCCQPYGDARAGDAPNGAPNVPADLLLELARRATAAGLEVALHAIGDAALAQVLDVLEATGARGSIEHAQLVDLADLPRWARLPVRASVQPAHLLDDRELTELCWADRTHRTFPLRSILDAGIELVLGSDAPVAPLDPWLAMAAAVHRGHEGEESWHPEQAISPREALAASVDGQRLAPGGRGDVVLLDQDPLGAEGASTAERAKVLRGMTVSATVLGGTVVHGG